MNDWSVQNKCHCAGILPSLEGQWEASSEMLWKLAEKAKVCTQADHSKYERQWPKCLVTDGRGVWQAISDGDEADRSDIINTGLKFLIFTIHM